MEFEFFAVGYLGGSVNLKKFSVFSAKKFEKVVEHPEEFPQSIRIFFDKGEFRSFIYVTYSGFYVMRTMLNLEEEKIENAHEYIWSHPGFAEFALDFIKEVLEIENLNELESLIKSPEERPSGVKLMPLGGKVVLGFNDMDKVLVKSRLPDRLVKSRKPFGVLKDAELINDTFIYAPEISSESMNWILHWSLREGATSRIHMQLASFQDFVESTLTRISRMLNEENSEIWDRERTELERIKSSFNLYLSHFNGRFLSGMSALSRKPDWPFEDVKSSFEFNIKRITDTVETISRLIENISEILTWKSDKNLERQMAKVNFRMILLAVLALGITAIGALLSPQLNVTQKVFMLLFLVMIPPIFWLLEKMHNVKVRKTAERKFREIERNNLLKDLESIESNIKSIKSSPLLQESAEVYLRELETMRESIQRRLKEIDK